MNADRDLKARIRLLGIFEVRRGDRVIRAEDWPRKKAGALLKRLAWEHRLLKDQAIEFLFPESDPASAANNLYKTIQTLRQTLNINLGHGAAEAIFRFEDGILSLTPSLLWSVSLGHGCFGYVSRLANDRIHRNVFCGKIVAHIGRSYFCAFPLCL